MEYKEAAKRLAALAVCTEQVPVGCDKCQAYTEGKDGKKQQKACSDMLAAGKIEEAIEAVREYEQKQAAAAAESASN